MDRTSPRSPQMERNCWEGQDCTRVVAPSKKKKYYKYLVFHRSFKIMIFMRGVTLCSKGLLRRFGEIYCLHLEGDILVQIPIIIIDHKFPSNFLYTSDMYFPPSFWMKFNCPKDRSSPNPEKSDQSFITQRKKKKQQEDHDRMNDNIKMQGFFPSCSVWKNTKWTLCGNLTL